MAALSAKRAQWELARSAEETEELNNEADLQKEKLRTAQKARRTQSDFQATQVRLAETGRAKSL